MEILLFLKNFHFFKNKRKNFVTKLGFVCYCIYVKCAKKNSIKTR